jgi:hypothetical protein
MRQALPPWRVGRRSDRSSDSHLSERFPLLPERVSLWSASLRVEVDVFDGQVPVRIEDLEPPLLFFLVAILVRIELLDQGGAVEIVVGDRRIFEADGNPVIPAPVFGGGSVSG